MRRFAAPVVDPALERSGVGWPVGRVESASVEISCRSGNGDVAVDRRRREQARDQLTGKSLDEKVAVLAKILDGGGIWPTSISFPAAATG
jgi:hypothetical protein